MVPLDPGLYAAVLAEPESDHPRLVLADWLEENGEGERAELVRVQVELAKFPASFGEAAQVYDALAAHAQHVPDLTRISTLPAKPETVAECAKFMVLRRRERELLDSHGADWFRSDRGMVDGSPLERNAWHYRPLPSMHRYRYWLGYRRGFLGAFDGPLDNWIDHGKGLVSLYPVEAVSLVGREPWANATFASWDNQVGWEESNLWHIEGWTYLLPPAIFALLDPPEHHTRGGRPAACFPSKDAAVAALSRACLRWARSE